MAASNSRHDVEGLPRSRTSRTHCLRGHEFTPDNTQWVNVPAAGPGNGRAARSRLCRICSRARARRYLDSRPPRKAQPLPPLPNSSDAWEVELERYIRRVLRARAPLRAAVLWEEIASRLEHHGFQVKSGLHRVPIRERALHKESFGAYAARTSAGWDDHGDWFVCRMLDDSRIQTVLNKAHSRYAVLEPGEVNPRVPRRRRSGSIGRSATRRRGAAGP